MKILFVLELYYPNIGGVEKLFKSLADELVKQKHEVLVVTTRSRKHLQSYEVIEGVHIRRLPFANRFAFTFFSLPWLLFYGRRVDYFHTTSYNAAAPAFLAARLLRKKCFITFHEYWGRLWFQLPHLAFITRLLFFLYEKCISRLPFDKFIAVSESTRLCLIGAGVKEERIVVIYNGIDYSKFDQFQLRRPARFTMTYFGRIGVSKGVEILLEASRLFFKQDNDAKLKIIVPSKPKRSLNRVKRYVLKNNLTANIVFLHNLDDEQLKEELSTSSCVVIPSYSEGFCFAAVEVIAMGIPLISSDKTALREVVSGTYIKMEELSVPCLLNAMQKARANQWTVTTIKYFRLQDCVQRYKEMYK
jgi:glycosyltransferase involved in cell wall biosynthesis